MLSLNLVCHFVLSSSKNSVSATFMMLNDVSWPNPDHKNISVCEALDACGGGGGDL